MLNRLDRADTLRFSFFHDHARDYKGYLSADKLVGMRRSPEPTLVAGNTRAHSTMGHTLSRKIATHEAVCLSMERWGEERRGWRNINKQWSCWFVRMCEKWHSLWTNVGDDEILYIRRDYKKKELRIKKRKRVDVLRDGFMIYSDSYKIRYFMISIIP